MGIYTNRAILMNNIKNWKGTSALLKLLGRLKRWADSLPISVQVRRRRKLQFDDRFEYQRRYNHFDIQSEEVVLDIGSGHIPFPYATILSDMYTKPTAHRYSDLVKDSRPLIIFDIHNLPFKDKSIDFVYCSHVLEHVDDPRKACGEICRVGKRGYIETPNFMKDVLFSWALGMHKWHTVGINNELHFFEYTERQARGIQSSIWGEMINGKYYHKMQDIFWDKQDLFNTMFNWKGNFICVVHRLNK